MLNKYRKGFTLIELLIVIGIIAILAGIVLVAVNPAEQFGKANDSERKSEIGMLLSAIYQAQTAPSARGRLPQCSYGASPATLADLPTCSGTTTLTLTAAETARFAGAFELMSSGTSGITGTSGTTALMDCSSQLIPSYLREIPTDPGLTDAEADANLSGYYMCTTTETGGQVTVHVLAPMVEVFNTSADDIVILACDNATGAANLFDCSRAGGEDTEVAGAGIYSVNAMAVEG